jgi:hypothetical protein
MAALHDIVTKGATDRSVVLRIINATTGVPEAGVVFNTSGIDLWYRREGAAKTTITEATLAALTTAHADGGFLHISDGDYRLDLPDAAFATGANYVDFGGTVTGMVVIGGRVRLVDFSLEVAALVANVTQFGGTNGTFSGGRPEVNASHWGGTAVASALVRGNVIQWTGTNVTTPDVAGSPKVTVTAGTGTGQISLSSGAVLLQATQTGVTIPTVTTLTNAPSDSAGVTTLLSRVPSGIFTGITSLAQWLGLIAGKQTGNSTARTEIRATGAGSGTFDETTDSQEAIRDNMGTAQTGDAFARLGAPAGASVSADIAAIEAQTDDIGSAGAGLTAVPWNPAWDAEVQSEVADALGVYDPPTNTEMEARTLVAASYATAANLATVDTVVDAIKITTDKVDDTLEDDGGTFRFTANALEEAPTGGSAPTAAAIADAVWEEAIADHSGTAGSTAEALNAAGSAGDPWVTALPGVYSAGQAGHIVGTNLNATVSSRATPAQVASELATYDGPTNAEMVARTLVAADYATASALTTVDGIVDDILVDTAAIDARLPSDPSDASIVAAATGAILAAVGTPVGVSLSADVAAVKAQTAAIEADTQDLQTQVGVDGAGLTAIGDTRIANLDATISSRATPAQVNTEADTALSDVGLTTTITGRIDAAVSSRLATASYTAPPSAATNASAVRTELTTELGRIDAAVSSRSSHSAADVWASVTRTLTNGAGIKKNTALAAFMFLMVDDTDGKTPETGLTITAQRSLDGAAFGACANSATEVSNGWYKIDLAAGDLNGDTVVLRFSGTGARTREIMIVTEP